MNYTNTYKQFAAASAYGEGAYDCGTYQQACTTTTAQVNDQSISAPLTGFLQQPAYIVLPTLLLIAVFIGALTFAAARLVRSRKK